MSDIGGMNYDLAQKYRHAIFLMVQTNQDWKKPIDCMVPTRLGDDENFQAAVKDAVIHFTGAEPSFEEFPGGVRITASGYYNTIGA